MNNEQFFAAGGPAFPRVEDDAAWRGMSLRDWFAGMALQGLLANGTGLLAHELASFVYFRADAMLAQRERWGNKELPDVHA